MIVAFERKPIVGRRDKPTLADPQDFVGKLLLPAGAQNMFNHGIREDKIEALVREGKRATVEDGVGTIGVT